VGTEDYKGHVIFQPGCATVDRAAFAQSQVASIYIEYSSSTLSFRTEAFKAASSDGGGGFTVTRECSRSDSGEPRWRTESLEGSAFEDTNASWVNEACPPLPSPAAVYICGPGAAIDATALAIAATALAATALAHTLATSTSSVAAANTAAALTTTSVALSTTSVALSTAAKPAAPLALATAALATPTLATTSVALSTAAKPVTAAVLPAAALSSALPAASITTVAAPQPRPTLSSSSTAASTVATPIAAKASGAPCTNEWHGVVCCPESHPRLQALSSRVCENEQVEPVLDGFAAGQTWPLGCASGSVTGTSIDRERCEVVGLALGDNNLNGELSADLPGLDAVDVRGNDRLQGSLPSWVAEAPLEVRLGVNDFDYNDDDSSLVSLFTRCRTDPSLACEGLPPRSCRAFGNDHVVALEDPNKCVACNMSLSVTVAIMVLLVLLFVAVLVGYIRLIYKYPDTLRRGVNTASLLIGHMQTVSILTSLQLSWPSSVLETQRWVFSPVNFFDLGATRPECVFGSIYYAFQIARVWSVIVLLLSVPLVQSLLKRKHMRLRTHESMRCCGKMITERTWDSLELAETIIFQIQFFVMLRAILGLVDSFGSHDDGALFAAFSALLLLLLEAGLVVKYLLNVRALVTGRTVGRFARLSADRLKLRMGYLTRRFADHAPYWQFVVWSRQFLLAIDAWLTRCVDRRRGHTVQ